MGRRFDFIRNGLLKGYHFDGCSGAPDFNAEQCCNRHDYDYQNLKLSRAAADRKLRKCLQRKGWVVLPWIYWAAVRVFGVFYFKRKQNESKARSSDAAYYGP